MDTLLFLYQNIIWLFAGILTGLTSFGGNLFAIPLLTLAIPVRDAILIGCLCSTVKMVSLAFLYRRWARWSEVVLLGLATLPGVPLGVAFLQHAGSRLLMFAAGAGLVLFLLWQFISGRLHVAEKPVSRWWSLPLGLAGGIMMSAVSMGGPPLRSLCVFTALEQGKHYLRGEPHCPHNPAVSPACAMERWPLYRADSQRRPVRCPVQLLRHTG